MLMGSFSCCPFSKAGAVGVTTLQRYLSIKCFCIYLFTHTYIGSFRSYLASPTTPEHPTGFRAGPAVMSPTRERAIAHHRAVRRRAELEAEIRRENNGLYYDNDKDDDDDDDDDDVVNNHERGAW